MSGSENNRRGVDRRAGRVTEAKTPGFWGTLPVVCAFAVSVIAGVGFLAVYWTGGGNLLLGGTLALFWGSLGCSLVLYSHGLMEHPEVVETREELPSGTEEREEVWEDFQASRQEIHRRGLLVAIGVAALGLVAAMIVSLFRSLGGFSGPSLSDTIWKRGQRLATPGGAPVSVNALEPGNMMIVFPENSIGDVKAQTVLIRVDERLLRLPGGRENWAPMGYVAYSRVCTHAGCPVGLFETTAGLLMCPCHQSTFDVLRGAQPTGGPAARALPQLPLYADANGNLRAGGGFTEPPGPGFWSLP